MALTNTYIPSASADVLGVFDQNFNQLFVDARPIKGRFMPNSKPMEHPVENGTIITDHRIILPVEIELSMILLPASYRSTYQTILQHFTAGTLLTVQSRVDTYSNMLISAPPHEENPDMFDAIPLALKLKQVQIVAPQYGALPPSTVSNPTDTSTVNRGQQQAGTTSTVTKTVATTSAADPAGMSLGGTDNFGGGDSALPAATVKIRPNDASNGNPLSPLSQNQAQDLGTAAA